MGRIPMPERVAPAAFRGDRLAMSAPDLSAPGRALQGLGSAVGGLVGKWANTAQTVKKYNANLALENWKTAEAESYERDKATAKPDGSDWVDNRAKYLTTSFKEVQATLKGDPEGTAKATDFFNATYKSTIEKAMADSVRMAQVYVMDTTAKSVDGLLGKGTFTSLEQYNDYYQNAVKPRLASVFTDPAQLSDASNVIAKQMRTDLIRRFPQIAAPVPREDGKGFTLPPMPQGGVFEGMTPDEWQDTAVAAMRADRERIKAEAEAREAKADETVKSGYDLVSSGQMNTDWIEGNKDNLSPAQYRIFNAAHRRKVDAKSDPETFTRLASRAVREDVQDEAFQAYAEGRISKADMSRLIGMARQTAADETERPWLIEARKSLVAKLSPVDTEDYDQYSKRLEGLFALNDWVDANPKATRDEVKKKANEIATEYNTTVVGNLRASLDLPKFAPASRFTMSEQTLSQSAAQLMAAYQAGRLNLDDLNKQTALLKRWKTVFDEEAKLGTSRL